MIRKWRLWRLACARANAEHWKHMRVAAPECAVYYGRCLRRIERLERKLR